MKSIAGFVISIIGAVLWVVLMLLLIVNWYIFNAIFLVIGNDLNSLSLNLKEGYYLNALQISLFPYFPIAAIVLIWFIFIGILTLFASIKMNKDKSVRSGGIMAIILGVLSLNPFTITGGIIGLIDSKR